MDEISSNPAIGRNWDEVEREIYTLMEIAEGDMRVAQMFQSEYIEPTE